MARVSMGSIWDETRLFVLREWSLLLPVTLATIGFGALLLNYNMPPVPKGELLPPPGSWMWWMIPNLLLSLLGSVALTILALVGGISVGEALTVAVRRMPAAIGYLLLQTLLHLLLVLAIAMPLSVLTALTGRGTYPGALIGVVFLIPVVLWLTVRFSLTLAVIVDRVLDPVAAMRRSFALVRPVTWRLALIYAVLFLGGTIAANAVQLALGAIFLLIGKLVGSALLGPLLVLLLSAALGAIVQLVLVIYAAFTYRRLAGSSSGI